MNAFSWLDNRTLIAGDFMLAIAFAAVFFGMKRAYPNLRGINTIAISFLLGVPGTFLLDARGSIPYILSVTVAHCFVLGSFVFLYRGILRFIGSRRTAAIPISVSCIALAILFYYSQIQDSTVPRIVAISLTVGTIRGLIALELFRKSRSFTSPMAMRVFAACMSLFAAITVNCGIMVVIQGAPAYPLTTRGYGTATLLLGVLSLFVTGLFILVLSSGELIAASRDESQKDSLSGALNRRGIEVKLMAELKRIQGGKSTLSIALIDVDYFKSINDIQGHAAGDAALRDVADTISSHLRGRDYLGRYGGDEFLLILPHTACGIALGVTERLWNAISNIAAANGSMPLTLSIGLTEAVPEDNAVTLIARADKALYQAKSDGRNCRRVIAADADAALEAAAMGNILMPPVESSLLH